MSSASSSSPDSPELRKDHIFNRWVIFSSARSRRPSDLKVHSPTSNPNPKSNTSCPFCAGHEDECAPEIFRVPAGSSVAGWKVRVIENLYPALRRELEPPNSGSDVVCMRGFGFHDVVIETPSHNVRLPDLSDSEIKEVVLAFKERIEQLRRVGSIKYVQVFKNYGATAGASLSHSHSQIIGLPIVPPMVSTRLDSMKEYFDRTGKCGLCDIQLKKILIDESSHFYAIVPFAASNPFEIWIVPRKHASHFYEIDDERAADFGCLLKLMLLKLTLQLNDPPFNFMIHTAPFELPLSSSHSTHWFLQIVPQLHVIGGFETGTACYINAVFPEDAAKILREVKTHK
ncbi:ADP-glucose phosphorylase [Dioscorea cayenensis subsp. rotundata]|uniref:ADP-glucose phosphorylase n=1 Tax=Dioscorea cayennensis subsp. rotundata TaxID=55577 RepID=A0AB40BTV5_DIOCR|nr:ADP-glucose phosphorylase [Dioscorea cayenensis subsp. rotundata]